MKKRYLLSILIAGSVLAACGGEGGVPVDPGTLKPEPQTRTLTFVLPQDGFKTAWEAGDQIVVHGEYAADEVTVTLAGGDISADGSRATKEVSGLYPYVREDCGSNLYASWPASAADNLRHCFFYSGFKTTNAVLLAACNDEADTFTFRNLSSAVSFSVSGDFDSYAFTARKDAVIGYEYYQVKLTDREENLNQYRQGPMVTVSGPLAAGGSQILYLPGSVDLPAGYVLKLFKNGKALKALTVKEGVSVERGEVLSLGDVTGRLEDYELDIDLDAARNLGADGTANCYVVTAPGPYKFAAVKGNGSTSVGAADAAAVLWETWGNDAEVTRKSVIQSVMYEGGYVYFQVAENHHPGNALIVVRDEDDNILWSWHIWVPETMFTVDTYGYTAGCSIMSRNLGALVDTTPGSVADARSFGLLYQWGRKDPFLGARAAGSVESATFYGTEMTVYEGQMSQEEAAAQPAAFASVNGIDWNKVLDREAWGDQERTNVKTIYDPCPPGYRVAGRKRATIFTTSGSTFPNWKFDADNYFFQLGEPVSTLPLCGYLNADGTYAAGESIVWNTHMDADTPNLSYCMTVSGGASGKGQKARALGASIRCETE